MSSSTERKVRFGFVAALVLLALIGTVSYRSVNRLSVNAGWVGHTHEVINRLGALLSTTVDAETGERGYVITGDEAFLAPYRPTPAASEAEIQTLLALTVDNPGQHAMVQGLAPLVAERMAVVADVIEIRRTQGFEAAARLVKAGQGKRLEDRVRAFIAEIKDGEELLLQERVAVSQLGAIYAKTIIASSGVFAFALVGLSWFAIKRDFAGREIADAALLTAKGQIEVLLAATQTRLTAALSAGSIGIWSWDLAKDRVVADAFVAASFGVDPVYAAKGVPVGTFVALMHEDDQPLVSAALKTAIENCSAYDIDYRVPRKEGPPVWLQAKGLVTCDGAGVALRFDGTVMDITARKTAELMALELASDLELKIAARTVDLVRANNELDSYSYTVAHDLRAPLRHIQGFGQMLKKTAVRECNLTPAATKYLDTILSASADMGRLVDDLLAFSRIGRTEMRRVSFSLNELIAEIIPNLELAPYQVVRWNIDPALPMVVGDRTLYRQVFINLLGNAVKYSRNRAESIIDVGVSGEEDGKPVIFVHDNGAGFNQQYADKLFGVFQRLHRADEFEGSGIGLAIVRQVIIRHGGRVWGEGHVGEGAIFLFTVDPAVAKDSNEPSSNALEAHPVV